MTGIQAGATHS